MQTEKDEQTAKALTRRRLLQVMGVGGAAVAMGSTPSLARTGGEPVGSAETSPT